jgi:RHS repeat-associated protein
MAGTLGATNPLRYRGYVYDTETGLYYLQSRYYDPEICRFINADGYASTGQGLLGGNAFAYCENEPVKRDDARGHFWNVVIGALVGGVIKCGNYGL